MRYLTEEEIDIATRFLFISMAIVIIQQDISHIKQGPFKIKDPYVQLLHRMDTIALQERKQLRKKMFQMNMQVIRGERSRFFSTFILIADQKREEKNYFNPAIRQHVEVVLRELMQTAGNDSEVSTND